MSFGPNRASAWESGVDDRFGQENAWVEMALAGLAPGQGQQSQVRVRVKVKVKEEGGRMRRPE